jgi:hypothetical protein
MDTQMAQELGRQFLFGVDKAGQQMGTISLLYERTDLAVGQLADVRCDAPITAGDLVNHTSLSRGAAESGVAHEPESVN